VVGAFEMKILCVREIYEERKRKKTKQNKKARHSHVMRKKGDSGCVMMIFFCVCDE